MTMRRGKLLRTLFAGVMLILELPLLLPFIAGAAVTGAIVRVARLVRRGPA